MLRVDRLSHYLGLRVSFKFKGLVLTGRIVSILTYTRRAKFKIEIDDNNILCEIYLDRNSFKVLDK